MLNQAPTEEQFLNGADQSAADSTLETASVSQSTRSGTTSGMTSSFMTSSVGATSSYSLKSMSSNISGSTLAPSSLSGSYTTSKSKSSLKKSPTKRYTPTRTAKDFSNYPGYNKLRLDSAVSPKHSPRSTVSASEKVIHSSPSFIPGYHFSYMDTFRIIMVLTLCRHVGTLLLTGLPSFYLMGPKSRGFGYNLQSSIEFLSYFYRL